MGLISNKIDRRKLKQGDHIYCYRKAHTYSHHGIYVEENRVIHFTNTRSSKSKRQPCGICGYQPKMERGVVKSCLDCFLKGSRLMLKEYNVSSNHFLFKKSGTCSTGPCNTPDVVVRHANDLLNGKLNFGNYDLFENNCECFAICCKTGVSTSLQAFSMKSKAKLALKGLTGKPFSLKNVALTFGNVIVKHKIELLHHDKLVHKQICNDSPSTSKNDDKCEDYDVN